MKRVPRRAGLLSGAEDQAPWTGQGLDVPFAVPALPGTDGGPGPATGSVTWTAAMAGVKAGSSGLGTEVTGDAEMTADPGAASLDLAFTDIADTSDVRIDDIRRQDVPMRSRSFQAAGLDGRFHGPNRKGAGGVSEHNRFAGAFSLARQQEDKEFYRCTREDRS